MKTKLLAFLLFPTIALASGDIYSQPCHIHSEATSRKDVALFHSWEDANAWANSHEGKILASDDNQTFVVLYVVNETITHWPDDCKVN